MPNDWYYNDILQYWSWSAWLQKLVDLSCVQQDKGLQTQGFKSSNYIILFTLWTRRHTILYISQVSWTDSHTLKGTAAIMHMTCSDIVKQSMYWLDVDRQMIGKCSLFIICRGNNHWIEGVPGPVNRHCLNINHWTIAYIHLTYLSDLVGIPGPVDTHCFSIDHWTITYIHLAYLPDSVYIQCFKYSL